MFVAYQFIQRLTGLCNRLVSWITEWSEDDRFGFIRQLHHATGSIDIESGHSAGSQSQVGGCKDQVIGHNGRVDHAGIEAVTFPDPCQ